MNRREFLQKSFQTLSIYNHGPFIHHLLIEPMFRKLCGRGSHLLPAYLHRTAWEPLYYPESIVESLHTPGYRIGNTRFDRFKSVPTWNFVEAVVESVKGFEKTVAHPTRSEDFTKSLRQERRHWSGHFSGESFTAKN